MFSFEELEENRERFRRAVHRREIIETTGIGHGVAIAHGKLPCIDKVRISLGISKDGIDFQSKDGRPVHLLFVISSSPFTQLDYLKALASILKSVHNEDVREELLDVFCNDHICKVGERFFTFTHKSKVCLICNYVV